MIAYPNSYDKIVIVCYPPGAGGKFLINNLGLNDQAVFQDAILARRQINGDFSYNNKLSYLSAQFEHTVKNAKWNDLGLGCGYLFGYCGIDYQTQYPEILANQTDLSIPLIISENLFLFLVAHDTMVLRSILNFWTNAKVIGFTNFENFINTRSTNLYKYDKHEKHRLDYWNAVKGEAWPDSPPKSKSEFLLLPDWMQSELIDDFKNEISRLFDTRDQWVELYENDISKIKKDLNSRFYQIDVDEFYKDEQIFLSTLKDCLQWLDLPMPQNDHDNCQYFQTWKATLDLINTPD